MFPGATMPMTRTFKIGQSLVYYPDKRTPKGRYIVLRLVPQPDGRVYYQIRSQDDPSLEFTADARELRKA
jgi:hypothetical protein